MAKNELQVLYETLLDRKEHAEVGSYTAYLYEKGLEKILKKIGEEATEVIIASMKENNKAEIVNEISDLLYHVFVLMAEKNISLDDINNELEKRSQKTGNLKPERKPVEKY
ncbi:phosphoribosyl-ATP pyrophosphatase [Erysipelotrichaceae bacterium MTC7]|nr:phosphoribosyl-ATP pyrophosphatase [Erysipelotrichaceae bacterium MTC7]